MVYIYTQAHLSVHMSNSADDLILAGHTVVADGVSYDFRKIGPSSSLTKSKYD